VVVALLSEAERRSADPLIGLHAATHSAPRGPLQYLMLSSSRLESSLRHWERFARIPISSLRVQVDVSTSAAVMRFDFGDAALEESAHVADYMLLAVLRALRQATAFDVNACEVRLRHAGRGDPVEVERCFGCAVRFGRDENALVFHRRDLDAPSRIANPLIEAELARFTAALESRLAPSATWRERVADVARALVAEGVRADRASVARRLHVSEASLQRALAGEGTTFKAVRAAVVWQVAEALLSNEGLKVEAIASSVGFADGPAFAKAFKRHFGVAPTTYRQRRIEVTARPLAPLDRVR
jgi:AraC-like DNA-binding protein